MCWSLDGLKMDQELSSDMMLHSTKRFIPSMSFAVKNIERRRYNPAPYYPTKIMASATPNIPILKYPLTQIPSFSNSFILLHS